MQYLVTCRLEQDKTYLIVENENDLPSGGVS